MKLAPHPSRYSRELLPQIEKWTRDYFPLLDPFAGIGSSGIRNLIHGEIEWEWLSQCPQPSVLMDAFKMPFRSSSIGAVTTSPCYGNRMADHHVATDSSVRNTYRHKLNRNLHPSNTGQIQWGPAYRASHRAIWLEVHRVLKTGGRFVLNSSDHIRKGEVQPVTAWHINFLKAYGFEVLDEVKVQTPRNRFGANSTLRVDHESLFLLEKVE